MATNDDDKIPRCTWGEKLVGKYSHRVYKIVEFSYRTGDVKLREEVSGNIKIVTLEQVFDNFEHYVPWYEMLSSGGEKD